MTTIEKIHTYELAAKDRVPRKINDGEDHERALQIVEHLMDKGEQRTEAEDELLATWVDLITVYESAISPEPLVEPLAMLRHLMESQGIKAADLVPAVFGSRGYASQVLNGAREVSKETAIRLAKFFKVPVDFFIPVPYVEKSDL